MRGWFVSLGSAFRRRRADNPPFSPLPDHAILWPSTATHNTPILQASSDNITFQITVSRLNFSPRLRLHEKDVRVTVGIGDISKTTCAGKLSEDGRMITWNHPFFFTVPYSTAVMITIYTLPEEFTIDWGKKPLGEPIHTNVANLLGLGRGWKCSVPGLHDGFEMLSMTCRACNDLTIPERHDCLSALEGYSNRLHKFNTEFNNISAVSMQIEVQQSMLDLCPNGHTKHTILLGDLAVAISFQFDIGGNISDLNRAIEIEERRLQLCPLGHAEHAKSLGNLATYLSEHYRIQGNQADLNRIIEMGEEMLKLCPPGHQDHATALGNLAISLFNQYNMQGNINDLNKAIGMEEGRLYLCPPGHPQHLEALGNFAVFSKTRYLKEGDLSDLERAIQLQEKILAQCPPGHTDHTLALQHLASSLKDRYHALKSHSDLINAIKWFREALDSYPAQHSDYAAVVDKLAQTILLPFNSLQADNSSKQMDHPPLQEAFQTYMLLKACGPAVSMDLWRATQTWIKNAEKYSDPSVLQAYQTSLDTLDHLTSMQSSLDSRHETMQTPEVADLANNAFSCAVRHGDLQLAVKLLEQGRGILWNQLACFDISIDELENQGDKGRKLGDKFTQLSAKLRKHAQGSGATGTSMDPYWRVRREWQSVVDEIRRQDGFSRFLLPPHPEYLQQAAECGPVVIVNASTRTCDALIVLQNRPPIHTPLPDCSLDEVARLCSQFSELIQNPLAYGENRESWLKQSLRSLWSIVVEPVVLLLQNNVQLPAGSRIWWCPTSKFTILPLHAAGPYRKNEKNLIDIYISSYVTSLSALIRARERARSQKKIREASGLPEVVSFVGIGQARPSAAMKLCELPRVEQEIQMIRNETHMPSAVDRAFKSVTGEEATVERAVQAFKDHRWVHLACHGAQHATKPFESWFAMGDGPLTLMRIIKEPCTLSEFAFLSACHTAVGDKSTPDEVLHLAAGMQFAGFNGVIGTLWRVDDSIAHEVVTRFYMEMFEHGSDFEHAAAALNLAVVGSANKVPLEKRIVFVHIGV